MKSSSRKSQSGENNKKCTKAIAFGREYFHALGGFEKPQTEKEKQEKDDKENGKVETSQDIPYLSWDCPPWTTADDSPEADIQQAVASAQSTVFLTKSGKIYQTGTVHGQIYEKPTPIITKLPLPCVEISAGRHFCLGRVKGGVAVFSWGAGHFGQLGQGVMESDRQLTFTPQPIVIQQLLPHAIGSPIKQIAAGDWHALALTEAGRIWAWGSNRSHQCGRKPSSRNSNSQATTLLTPMPIPLEVSVDQIGAGRSHSVAITKETRQIYCWGSTLHGQCGNVVRKTPVSPHLVDGLSELGFQKISVAGNHTLALTTGGRLFSWGDNSEGQLGHSPACPAVPRAKQVQELDFVAIAAAYEVNKNGGQKDQDEMRKDTKLLKSLPQIVDVFAGPAYSVVTTSAGHMYCFGSNDVNQLGMPMPSTLAVMDNTVNPEKGTMVRETDIQVFDSRHIVLLPTRNTFVDKIFVKTVACGPNHMCVIGRDRTKAEVKLQPAKTLHEAKNMYSAHYSNDPSPDPSNDNVEVSVALLPSPKADLVTRNCQEMASAPILDESETTAGDATQTDADSSTNLSHLLPQQDLQVQTGPNVLAGNLISTDAPTPSTVGEFTIGGVASPSSTVTNAVAETTTSLSPKTVKQKKERHGPRGMGVIRGISLKFRRRFGGKKRAPAGADLESDSEQNVVHERRDKAK